MSSNRILSVLLFEVTVMLSPSMTAVTFAAYDFAKHGVGEQTAAIVAADTANATSENSLIKLTGVSKLPFDCKILHLACRGVTFLKSFESLMCDRLHLMASG